MKRQIGLVLIGIMFLTMGLPAFAAYTDLAKLVQDVRKAKDDHRQIVELYLRWLNDSMAKSLAENNDQPWRGYAEKWKEAAASYKKLEADPKFDKAELERLKTEINKTGQAIKDGHAKVVNAKLNAPPPKDAYAGSDKKELIEKIKTAWKQNYPAEEIVAVRFPNADWERKKEKNWVENGKYYQNVDVSVLTAKVIVKKDADVGTIFGIYVQRDNDNPGKGVSIGRKGTFAPEDILLKNLK